MRTTGQTVYGRESAAGFTMIEIMLVLALVGSIMAAVVYGLRKQAIAGQVQAARLQIRQLGGMFFQHRFANDGECPSIEQWLVDKTLKTEPKDPWGHAFVIVCPAEHDEGGADIVSLGPDGRPGKDDIESWKLP